jgi:GntR family transcriptional repressor for pyruvate dehydrogenase complex
MLEPVARRSLPDAVFDQLQSAIVAGTYEAGAPLPSERELAELLQVNRNAVREALKRLAQARLVAIRHGGSTRVLDYRKTAGLDLLPALLVRADGGLDTAVVRDVMAMRSAMAPAIAAAAAKRGGSEAVATAGAAFAKDAPIEELQRRSLELWEAVVEASGNLAFRFAFNGLAQVYGRFMPLLTQALAAELGDRTGHAAVAEAVMAGNEAGARAAAAALTAKGETSLGSLLAALDGGAS